MLNIVFELASVRARMNDARHIADMGDLAPLLTAQRLIHYINYFYFDWSFLVQGVQGDTGGYPHQLQYIPAGVRTATGSLETWLSDSYNLTMRTGDVCCTCPLLFFGDNIKDLRKDWSTVEFIKHQKR